jgi:RimJ/RimL family protein N-acetyltransferase
MAGVRRTDPAGRRASLGYWLGAGFRGHGYMKEAIGPALAAAMGYLGLDAIEAFVKIENFASIAVVEHAGMACLGSEEIHIETRQRRELCFRYELTRETPTRTA